MMMRSRLIAAIALMGLAAPLTGIAQTYLTPEQVLLQNDGAFLVPSHNRGTAWQVELQDQQNIARHPSILRDPWEPVVDRGIPPPNYPEIVTPSLTPAQAAYPGLDPVTARLLVRLAQQNSILASTAAGNAPLAGTGPASTIAMLAMAAATIWTIRRARVLERFVKEL